jgi:hypothetical protein
VSVAQGGALASLAWEARAPAGKVLVIR